MIQDSQAYNVVDENANKRGLRTCGLLYPDLMKTRNAVIEHQNKHEEVEETVEAFEGDIK